VGFTPFLLLLLFFFFFNCFLCLCPPLLCQKKNAPLQVRFPLFLSSLPLSPLTTFLKPKIPSVPPFPHSPSMPSPPSFQNSPISSCHVATNVNKNSPLLACHVASHFNNFPPILYFPIKFWIWILNLQINFKTILFVLFEFFLNFY